MIVCECNTKVLSTLLKWAHILTVWCWSRVRIIITTSHWFHPHPFFPAPISVSRTTEPFLNSPFHVLATRSSAQGIQMEASCKKSLFILNTSKKLAFYLSCYESMTWTCNVSKGCGWKSSIDTDQADPGSTLFAKDCLSKNRLEYDHCLHFYFVW